MFKRSPNLVILAWDNIIKFWSNGIFFSGIEAKFKGTVEDKYADSCVRCPGMSVFAMYSAPSNLLAFRELR